VKKQGAATTLDQRREFATRAFGVSSHYDTAINAWFERTK
jgi:phosphoribosylaminoimidazolecarboxamide formyltransferase/IMP cyclohydrolase